MQKENDLVTKNVTTTNTLPNEETIEDEYYASKNTIEYRQLNQEGGHTASDIFDLPECGVYGSVKNVNGSVACNVSTFTHPDKGLCHTVSTYNPDGYCMKSHSLNYEHGLIVVLKVQTDEYLDEQQEVGFQISVHGHDRYIYIYVLFVLLLH